MNSLKSSYKENGFVVIPNLLDESEIQSLRDLYAKFLDGHYDTSGLRSDLTGGTAKGGKESITQIMRPALRVPSLLKSDAYIRIVNIARKLSGEDMDVDFDMLICKYPMTNKETPWHQDAAYWIDLPDKRAISFWVALDDVDEDNGCMSYVRGSHTSKEVLEHTQAGIGGALKCTPNLADKEVFVGKINSGDSIGHHGHTLHYAFPNISDRIRRAWIVNLRPKKMIELERAKGYNHLGSRKNTIIE